MTQEKHVNFDDLMAGTAETLPKRTPEEAAKLLLSDEIGGYDRSLITNTIVELAETGKMFRNIRHIPKITVFGSARTAPDHPDYLLAKEFGRQTAELGYMIITGAGPGIMAAASEGAGPDKSIGVGIKLPFEQGVNRFNAASQYLINYRYFFCRKLTFIREADAVVLFPGGFGTMDEAFEALTLLHTGRSMPVPFVLMEQPGGTYWEEWLKFLKNTLLKQGMINQDDLYLFRRFDNCEEAVDYLSNFYRRYHSMRYSGDKIIIRLNRPVPEKLLETLKEEYADFLGKFGIQKHEGALKEEEGEPDLAHLPRLILQANRKRPVDLYLFIRSLNREVISSSTRRQDREEVQKTRKPLNPRPRREKVY